MTNGLIRGGKRRRREEEADLKLTQTNIEPVHEQKTGRRFQGVNANGVYFRERPMYHLAHHHK